MLSQRRRARGCPTDLGGWRRGDRLFGYWDVWDVGSADWKIRGYEGWFVVSWWGIDRGKVVNWLTTEGPRLLGSCFLVPTQWPVGQWESEAPGELIWSIWIMT